MYDWVFNRKVGSVPSDKFIVMEGDRLVGGSALTFRPLRTCNGKLAQAAVITGSFTLPDFRKQGFFSTIIDLTFKRAVEQGAFVYLGFAAAKNMSVNRLREAGCEISPSYYFQFDVTKANRTPFQIRTCGEEDLEAQKNAFEIRSKRTKGKSHFEYSLEEWRGQMINRPHPAFLCEVSEAEKKMGYFIAEKFDAKYRLIEFFGKDESLDEKIVLSAMDYARQSTDKMDAYTIEANIRKIFQGCQGSEIPGLLFLRACSPGQDRLLTQSYLGQNPGQSDKSLLPFCFQSGDRM